MSADPFIHVYSVCTISLYIRTYLPGVGRAVHGFRGLMYIHTLCYVLYIVKVSGPDQL